MLTRDAVGGTPGLGHGIMTVIVVVLSGRIFPVGRDLHLGCAFDNGNETENTENTLVDSYIAVNVIISSRNHNRIESVCCLKIC